MSYTPSEDERGSEAKEDRVLCIITPAIFFEYNRIGFGFGLGLVFGTLGTGALSATFRIDGENEVKDGQERS